MMPKQCGISMDNPSIFCAAIIVISLGMMFSNEISMRKSNKRCEEGMHKLGFDTDGSRLHDTEEILATENQEVRSALIEKWDKKDLEEIDSDETGTLYSTDTYPEQRVVKVKNSTPEADGTFKTYWLRVPSNIETAGEAVAWTFGLDEDEYNPIVES